MKRLLAIGFIFGCTTIAWFVLAGVTTTRTYIVDHKLRQQVEHVWGSPQVQQPPNVTWTERINRQVESIEDGKKVVKTVESRVQHPIALHASDIEVSLKLDHRQKGLLWYATYAVDFVASYAIVNTTGATRELDIALPFPSKNAVFDDLRFEVDGKPWLTPPSFSEGWITGQLQLAAGERAMLRAGYRSQGLERWTYQFGSGVAEVKDFRLAMRTNFDMIDFPDGSISPGKKERSDDGWLLTWEFRRLVSGVNIAIVMPEKLQPGPLAGEIATFAPISLFFFILVLLTIGVVKGIDLHPMHFFFLAAAFFAFHLLFSYLVDQVSIHTAFVISAITSLALVISYLRLVFGSRFALFAAGVAQLVLSGAVFICNFSGAPMHDISGVAGAAPVWREVMDFLHESSAPGRQSPPAGHVLQPVAFAGGLEPERGEWFLAGTEAAKFTPLGTVAGRPRIASPVNGALYAIDPDIPRERQRIALTARGAQPGVQFLLDDGRRVRADAPFLWLLPPGIRQIILVDRRGNEIDHVRFEVRGLRPARVVNARTGENR